MNIGVVMKHVDKAKCLRDSLIENGCEVTIYRNAQEMLNALLTAKCNSWPLPHTAVLIDLDLGDGIDGPETIRRARLFVSKSELTFILLSGRSVREESLISNNLLDVKVLSNDVSAVMRETRKFSGLRGERQ